jgi:predicted P-loop ATPase
MMRVTTSSITAEDESRLSLVRAGSPQADTPPNGQPQGTVLATPLCDPEDVRIEGREVFDSPSEQAASGQAGKSANNPKGKKKAEKSAEDNRPAIEVIRDAMEKRWDFRHNLIKQETEYRSRKTERAEYEPVNVSQIYVELQLARIEAKATDIEHILRSNLIDRFNPVEDYFASLPDWDGKMDYIALLSSFVRAEDQNEFDRHFKMALVRMVACALGVEFNKQCLTLIGKQNDGKSSFLRFLCPPRLSEYITENIDPRDKEGIASVCQNFVINLDELATLGTSTLNNIKALFSLDRVKYRPPYAKRPETLPRIANFVGSTNSENFLIDETGSVRWLCFRIHGIDFAYRNRVNIDAVYAQAYALLKRGFGYNLTGEDLEGNHERNRAFEAVSVEYELIAKHVQAAPEEKENFKNATEILQHLNLVAPTIRDKSAEAIGKAMKKAGFERKPLRKDGKIIRGYYAVLV